MSSEFSLEKWREFYRPHFRSAMDGARFVEACAAQSGATHAAKIIMHQVRRLVMLADQMRQLRPARDSLSVFWYAVCAEAVSKLQAGYEGEGRSREHVRRFFSDFASPDDQALMVAGFKHPADSWRMTLQEAADTLYDVRCSVAHEGNYWEFTMASGTDMLNVSQPAIVSMTLAELRDVVVRTGIRAAQSRLPRRSLEAAT